MLKSFLKRVFSSSSETVATSERQVVKAEDNADALDNEKTAHVEESGEVAPYDWLILRKEWLDPPFLNKASRTVTDLYERAEQFPDREPTRLRLRLDESLREIDVLTAKRIGKYLARLELETIDFTFFLDKKDATTMSIYREYVLPERVERLNPFLRERCLMIYETCESLGRDYKEEIKWYVQSLGMVVSPIFFEEFDQWREQIMRKSEEEWLLDEEERSEENQETIMLKISKEEVENENIEQIDRYLNRALQSPVEAKALKETLLFSFYGFSDSEDLLKLMNRSDVAAWASLLVERHPYIFYFLNNEEYPMTQFLTSLVVSTEVEDNNVYYNNEELTAFKSYIVKALEELSDWVKEDREQVVLQFESCFK